MAEFTGSDLYATFAGTAITGEQREFSESEEMGIVDASAGNDVARTYLTTLEDGTATISVLAQTDGTAATSIWNLCDKGTGGTLIWGPEGTTSGKPKHTVLAIVTSRARSLPYADVADMTFNFQFNGVVTDGTWA